MMKGRENPSPTESLSLPGSLALSNLSTGGRGLLAGISASVALMIAGSVFGRSLSLMGTAVGVVAGATYLYMENERRRIARLERRQRVSLAEGELGPAATRRALTELRHEPLVAREASAALSMLDQIEERFARFETLLTQKLRPSGLVFDRYLNAGADVHSSVQSALEESARLVEEIRARRASRNDNNEARLERLAELLTACHYAIDRLDVINSTIPRMIGDGGVRLESSLSELERLADRTRKYSA